MKITYVIPQGVYKNTTGLYKGVQNKLDAQISSLVHLGVEIRVCNLGFSMRDPVSYMKTCIEAYSKLSHIYSQSSSDDIIYIRSFMPYIINTILSHRNSNPRIIHELQSIMRNPVRIKNNSLLRIIQIIYLNIIELLCSNSIVNNVDAIVSVTNEITEHYKQKTKHNIPCLTLGNGIDVSSYHTRSLPEYNNKLNVLIVANTHRWHGIDRFIRGMHEFSGDNTITLHIVGDGPELPNLKSLTSELHLESHVIFHGFKSGADLDAMFDQCHIAIDALAGFRKNLTESSSLKAREYCAHGIPFLMASKDADFPETWEYTQMVPADESSIDMNTVISFAERVMADSEHPQKMHKYAEDHLDWLAKMKVLKEFLESL